jgi:carboxyl-terminal processing protease
MPPRNLLCLILTAVLALACYGQVQRNRYGRSLGGVLDKISRRYYEPVDDAKLFQAGVEGMVDQLGDDYSAYYSPREQQEFEASINKRFEGVGMEVTLDPKTKQLTVLTPLVGSPAYLAGIRAGDRILKVDGRSTQGMSLMDSIELLHGPPGTSVTLAVLHEGQQRPVEIEITRKTIEVDTVRGDTRNADGSWNFFLPGHEGIGYIRVLGFAEKTSEELRQALEGLQAHGMRGLVLDLRDNPGGLLPAAVGVCDLFIRSGMIVSTRGRDHQILESWQASGKGAFNGFPLAVLVNHESASASEIVAACLQDHHRAVIVGQRTWGKGTVQEVTDLGDRRGELKLTVASYWRPSGENIHRGHDAGPAAAWGVRPDAGCEVAVDAEEWRKLYRWRLERDVFRPGGGPRQAPAAAPPPDRQLARALAYVEAAAAKEPAKRP